MNGEMREAQGGTWPARLPWIDAAAAFTAGVAMYVFAGALGALYELPATLLRTTASVSLAYTAIGLTLGALPSRHRTWRARLLALLISANLAWALVCFGIVARYAAPASVFGVAHFAAEGVFVATLAALEWRCRRAILGG